MIRQLIYVSQPTQALSAAAERQILGISKRNNKRNGVTGLLASSSRHFLQVLEGRPADVQATFDRVSRDPRHRVRLLIDREVESRGYANWSMAYVYNLDLVDEFGALYAGELVTDPGALLQRLHPDSELGAL